MIDDSDLRLTVAAWARSLGISRQAGHAAVRRLGIEIADGKLHAAKASAIYAAMTRPRPGTKPAAAVGPASELAQVSYSEAKRRTAVAEALMAERAEKVQAGELTRTAVLLAAWALKAAAVREHLLSVAARVSASIAGKTEGECFLLLTDEMHLALRHVSGAGE